jgi:hypothetical protein
MGLAERARGGRGLVSVCVSVCLLEERERVSETDELDTDARARAGSTSSKYAARRRGRVYFPANRPGRLRHDNTYHSHKKFMGSPPTGWGVVSFVMSARARQLVLPQL